MISPWIAIIAIVTIFVVAQSLALALQTWEHCRYGRSSMTGLQRHRPTGRAVLFAPCKGADLDLEQNLVALMCQDYDDFEVAFVVESLDDPACSVIQRVMKQYPDIRARLICAGAATDSGQKVHNLYVATANLPRTVQYLVFVDSDAQPRPEWLRLLVTYLDGRTVIATTGYRWFMPAKPTLANLLVYSINCSLMMLLDRSGRSLIWGGSWAIRRESFDELKLRQQWHGTLSDDFVARRVLAEAKRPTRFEPAAVVASPLDLSFGEMCSFMRRQYLIARFYSPGWWRFGVLSTTASAVAWLVLMAMVLGSFVWGTPSPGIAIGIFSGVYLVSAVRAAIRQTLVWTYFPEHEKLFRPAQLFDILAVPLASIVNALAMLSTVVGNRITWRGIRYRMSPGGQIRIERHELPLAEPSEDEELLKYRQAA